MKQNTLFDRAQSAGFLKKLFFYTRLSGPGWIQAAVTLGGGTLVGALYLGVVGGYEFLWIQPLAMLCGIIMLSAINYVTLNRKNEEDRPFVLAKKHVSPLLAWGWLLATVIADVVFCAAQFALGTDAIQGNLGGAHLPPFLITGILFSVSFFLIWLFSGTGRASAIIDTVIKSLVAIIVLAFMGVVITLLLKNAVSWRAIASGIIPDFSALFKPTESYTDSILAAGEYGAFWKKYIADNQRDIIIGAFGTAVGINMTFLLPYTLMKKGWTRKHLELSRFDLVLGLFLPFILGASALIISSASQFHAKKDGIVSEAAYRQVLDSRLKAEFPEFSTMNANKVAQLRDEASQVDKDLATMLAKRNANDLAYALGPFLGNWSQFIFGIGILAMALSTMLVHMMMNGYAISEAFAQNGNRKIFLAGAIIPAIAGFFSPLLWNGAAKTALAVPASVIATTLLPIAYLIFLLLMNSKMALGDRLPQKRLLRNIFLLTATGIATFASVWALLGKYQASNTYDHFFGLFGLIGLPILAIVGIFSFFRREKPFSNQ